MKQETVLEKLPKFCLQRKGQYVNKMKGRSDTYQQRGFEKVFFVKKRNRYTPKTEEEGAQVSKEA